MNRCGKVVLGFAIAFFLFLGGARAASASTETYNLHGDSCFVQSGSITYSQFGVTNSSTTTSATVVCPLTVAQQSGFTGGELEVNEYNRNSSVNTFCTLYVTDQEGDNLSSCNATTTANQSAVQYETCGVSTSVATPYWFVGCSIAPQTSSGGSIVTAINVILTY
jgi:hypothetical protein